MTELGGTVAELRRRTFSFGRNWRSFSRFVSEDTIREAEDDVRRWLGPDGVAGKRVIDVGCGSGIHSAAIFRLGPLELLTIDLDPHSVECARRLWEVAGKPANWRIQCADILDFDKLQTFGQFDVVYSWGVLHHTGHMWTAVENATRLAKPQDGRLWISLYTKGPSYDHHLKVKRRFNSWPWPMKQAYVWRYLFHCWRGARRHGIKLSQWFWQGRGMNAYHDAMDWFGGLPYEVASAEEVVDFLTRRGWKTERVQEEHEEKCSIYLFSR